MTLPRRFLAVLSLLLPAVAAALPLRAAGADPRVAAPGPAAAVAAASVAAPAAAAGDPAAEARLLEELLLAMLRLERAEEHLTRVRAEAEAARRAEAEARARRERTRRELEAARREAGRWLRFLYEDGSLRLLDVLLGASDFTDFVSRAETLGSLLERQAERLRRVRALDAEARRQAEDLAARRREAADRESEARRTVEALARLRTEKEAALGRAAAAAGGGPAAREALDRRWTASAALLLEFLRRFPALPWDRLQPDRVTFNPLGLGVEVEIGEATLDRTLLGADPRLAALRLEVRPGEVAVLPRQGGAAESFLLAGALERRGSRLAFVPVRLEVRGVPAGRATLEELAGVGDLSLDGSRNGLRLTGVAAEEGKLLLRFRPSGP